MCMLSLEEMLMMTKEEVDQHWEFIYGPHWREIFENPEAFNLDGSRKETNDVLVRADERRGAEGMESVEGDTPAPVPGGGRIPA